MGEAEIREHLSAFGLSATEIETYLAVLRRGEATTGDVAAAADVSQGYVYEVVETLADRGMVTVDESASPTLLRARPPEEAVGALSSRLDSLADAVESVYTEPDDDDGVGFEVVRSRETVERRVLRFLESAREEVFMVVPAPTFERMRDALAGAVDRGVLVYCLLVAPGPEPVARSIADPGERFHVLRTWDVPAPVCLLRDAEAGLFGSHGVLSGRHGDGYAVVFNQPDIANGFYGNTVSNVWPLADERFVADPPDLPVSIEFFRSGVTVAAQHVAAGRDLLVDASVTEIETGDRHRLEGVPVREVKQSLVTPVTSDFPIENALVVETADGVASIGGDYTGFDPYYETYAGHDLTLREA